MSLFWDDKILYIQDPKDSTKRQLEPIKEVRKVAGYKIDIQKISCFFMHYQWSVRKINFLKNASYNNIKNEILRYKFSRGSERTVHLKTIRHWLIKKVEEDTMNERYPMLIHWKN